jgi:hypothetical protein
VSFQERVARVVASGIETVFPGAVTYLREPRAPRTQHSARSIVAPIEATGSAVPKPRREYRNLGAIDASGGPLDVNLAYRSPLGIVRPLLIRETMLPKGNAYAAPEDRTAPPVDLVCLDEDGKRVFFFGLEAKLSEGSISYRTQLVPASPLSDEKRKSNRVYGRQDLMTLYRGNR